MRRPSRNSRRSREKSRSPWPWLAMPIAALGFGGSYWVWTLVSAPQSSPVPAPTSSKAVKSAPRIFDFYELLRQNEVDVNLDGTPDADQERAWFIQAGRFSRPNNARRRRELLVELGYEAARIERQSGIYHIKLGPYHSRGKIQHIRQQLQREGIDTILSLEPVPLEPPATGD